MEPEIPVGSAIYVSAVEPETLETGDVIVFNTGRSEVPVAHRVVENRRDAGEVVTKGDANEHDDPNPVPYANILGKVRFHLPRIGKALTLLGSVTGKLSLIALALAGTLLSAMSRLIRRRYGDS
jgi:signal peptidase